MNTTGKIYAICPMQEGTSENGNYWCKQEIVVEGTDGNHKKLAVTFLGEERVKMLEGLRVGDMVSVEWAAESEEYKERWYTKLKGYRIEAYQKI